MPTCRAFPPCGVPVYSPAIIALPKQPKNNPVPPVPPCTPNTLCIFSTLSTPIIQPFFTLDYAVHGQGGQGAGAAASLFAQSQPIPMTQQEACKILGIDAPPGLWCSEAYTGRGGKGGGNSGENCCGDEGSERGGGGNCIVPGYRGGRGHPHPCLVHTLCGRHRNLPTYLLICMQASQSQRR